MGVFSEAGSAEGNRVMFLRNAAASLVRVRDRFLSVCDRLQWLPPALGRLAIGSNLAIAGWRRLHYVDKVTIFLIQAGVPAAHMMAVVFSVSDCLFSLAVVLGLLTRLTALPLLISLVSFSSVAIAGHAGAPLSILFDTSIYVALLVWLIISGPGPLSVDWFICKRCADSRSKKSQ